MNTAELVDWQKKAPNGLVYPWWTHPLLALLDLSDFSGMTWCEFGAGRGTAWLRSKCKWVDSIEANLEWADQVILDCQEAELFNGHVHFDALSDGVEEDRQKYFDLIPKDKHYDIISVDGLFRTECLQWSLDHFKGNGGMIICDNWQQDYVYISEKAEQLMAPYEAHRYVQPDHTNHWGRPWNTTFWIIPA